MNGNDEKISDRLINHTEPSYWAAVGRRRPDPQKLAGIGDRALTFILL
jgi:hypothetical protein